MKLIRLICLVGLLPAAVLAAPAEVRLQVDARQPGQPLPYVYRAGVFLNSLPVGYPKEMFLSEQKPGMVEYSWDFYDPLLNAATEAEFFSRLPQSNLTAWVRETAAAGGEPYIRLMPIPRWLWSGGGGFRRPPRDWGGWERFVERIVDYYNNQLKVDVRYIVWDEPNGFWEGTTEDYLKLYRHAAIGLKRANSQARIGGPAPAYFDAAIRKGDPPLLSALVRYCAKTPLPGVADRLPLDMLVWHTFDAAPVSPGKYDLEVKAARKLLEDNGYPASVELNIGSWSPLEKYPEVAANVRDSEFLGAYVVASVIAMERAGVDRHAFFNLFEDWRRNPKEFSDDMGLLTQNHVAKAGYNGFRLLGRMQGSQLPVQVSDPFIQSAAAREGKVFRLLATNFVPPARMLRTLAQSRLIAQGHRPDELKKLAPELGKVLQDRRRIETWAAPADVRAAALGLHDAARLATQRQRESVSLQVAMEGLPAGRYRLREFRVDAESANAYAQRESIERRLARVKQEAHAATRDYLARRWTPAQMAQLRKLDLARGDLASRLDALPPERRQDARAALKLMQETEQKHVKEVNSRARPREQDQTEVNISGSFTWNAKLPPYGVVLLEAERID